MSWLLLLTSIPGWASLLYCVFKIWLCSLVNIQPPPACLSSLIGPDCDRRLLPETEAHILADECHDDKSWILVAGINRNADWCLSNRHSVFIRPMDAVFMLLHLFLLQDWVKMAEGSKDQGGVGTSDPEEDSPNMIVYRKVRLLCAFVIQYLAQWMEKHWLRAMTRRQAPDSSLVRINVYLPQVSGSLSFNRI